MAKITKEEFHKIDGTTPPHYFSRDELDGVTKEMWEATKFPKLSKHEKRKLKKLNLRKFIVYGTNRTINKGV